MVLGYSVKGDSEVEKSRVTFWAESSRRAAPRAGVARRGAPRAVSVSVRPRSGKFLAFITLTIVFLIQNYRAFVRGCLGKIPISSPEFPIFGDQASLTSSAL